MPGSRVAEAEAGTDRSLPKGTVTRWADWEIQRFAGSVTTDQEWGWRESKAPSVFDVGRINLLRKQQTTPEDAKTIIRAFRSGMAIHVAPEAR